MAVIKATNSKAGINKAIDYITKEEKTEEKLITGKDCNPETAKEEMRATKELYDKTEGRQYAHFVQSFNPKDKITPEKAHEIGKQFMENEKFKGHEVLMATHKDKDHIHNHFIVNSVNFEDGKKFHTKKQDYEKLKEYSNELSRQHELTVPEKSKEQGKFTTYDMQKYQAVKRAVEGDYKSHIMNTANTVKDVQEQAISKEDFIKKMQEQGYKTNWKDTSKHVTFIDPEGKRVRLANLEKTFNDEGFTKRGLTNEFERNKKEKETSRINEGDNREGTTNTGGTDTRAGESNSTRANEGIQQGKGEGNGKHLSETALDGIERKLREIKKRARANTPEGREEQRKKQQEIDDNIRRDDKEPKHTKDKSIGYSPRQR